MSRIEELWEILKEYGIKTPEQFMEAYRRCPKIDITVSYSTVVLATLELLTVPVTFCFGDISSVT